MGFWDKVKDAAGADRRRSAAEQISREREAEDTRERAEEPAQPAHERATIPGDPQIVGGEPEPAAGPEPVPTGDGDAGPQGEARDETQAEVLADAPGEADVPAPADAAQKQQTYTVRHGDTLSEIGEGYGVTASDLARHNGIENPDRIYPGQVLTIPQA